MKSLGLFLVIAGLLLAVILGVGVDGKSVQAAPNVSEIKYETSVIREGRPFVFRARGTSAGNWFLTNVDSADYSLSVVSKTAFVVVTLTVRKVDAGETDEASPMVSWMDASGKRVNVPLTILPKDSPLPSGASFMRVETVNGEKLSKLPFYTDGDWGDQKPLIYVPVGRNKE